MNIWQRFKNWLIVKLGGCTKKDYDAVNFWRKNACYWHEKYNAEHENYLVMLSLYNTTVEQKQNNAMQNVAIAADTIKDYCANRADCDGCPLHGDCGCKTADKACPEYWD